MQICNTPSLAVPKFESEGYTTHTIRIEYEWTPPRCSTCKVFGRVLNECPKKSVADATNNMKGPRQVVRGVQIGSKTKFAYRPKAPRTLKVTNDKNNTTVPSTSNSFDVQIMDGKLVLVDDDGKPLKKVDDPVNADSDSEVEQVFNEVADPYDDDDFDDCGLAYDQIALVNKFEISLRAYDLEGLPADQIAFAKAFDISLCDQVR
ncbi:hypothetical protein Tco_0179707 [Tanacetum coccineum]